MPNIIRIRNFEKENYLNNNLILPVDHITYGTVSKKINLYQINDYIFSGFTESSSSGTNGTTGIDGVIGISGQDGTSGMYSSSGLTHEVKILNYCDECNSGITGTFRYRTDTYNSYLEMCMQIGSNNYSWVNCISNTTTTTTIVPTTTTTTTVHSIINNNISLVTGENTVYAISDYPVYTDLVINTIVFNTGNTYISQILTILSGTTNSSTYSSVSTIAGACISGNTIGYEILKYDYNYIYYNKSC